MRSLTRIATLLVFFATVTGLHADTHRLTPHVFHNTFSSAHPPVMRLTSGDRVITTTVDDVGTDLEGRSVAQGPNPQTGPFFIESAEPGDLLVVTIEKLQPNRATGMSTSLISANAVDPAAFSSRSDSTRLPWTIDTTRGIVRFDLQTVSRRTSWRDRFDSPVFELPLRPTLGSIAVAPPGQDASSTTIAGPYGGNMGSAGLAAGARVMLPVFQPGALLFLGHGHARQGDGGITGTGIETSLDVEFSVEVVKKKAWPHSSVMRASTVVGEFEQAWPRIETDDYVMAVGSAPTLLQALQHATLELHHWLDDDFGLSERAVSVVIGQAIEYEMAVLGDSSFTMVAKVRKSYLPRAAAGR